MVGLYANLLAQVLSQIISHYIIYANRNVIAAARQAYESKESTKQPDVVSHNQYTGLEVEIASETDRQRRDEMRAAIRTRVSVRKHLYDTGRNDGSVSRLPVWFSMLVTFVGAVFVPLSILIAVGVRSVLVFECGFYHIPLTLLKILTNNTPTQVPSLDSQRKDLWVYVMFEREAREFQSCHSPILILVIKSTRITTYSYHILLTCEKITQI